MRKLHSLIFGSVLVILIGLSWSLRSELIHSASPTFDEPYYLFQAVHYAQNGQWFEIEINPPVFPWLLSKLATRAAEFKQTEIFKRRPEVFAGPYQYRIDEFSGLPADQVIVKLRDWVQGVGVLFALGLVFIAYSLGLRDWALVFVAASALFEPVFVSHSALLRNDMLAMTFLTLGISLGLLANPIAWIASVILLSLAWATKLTVALAVAPLAAGVLLEKIPRRALVLFVLGVPGAALVSLALGYPSLFRGVEHSNFRQTYLDGVIGLRPVWTYFLQLALVKWSTAFLVGVGAAGWLAWRGKARRGGELAGTIAIFAFALIGCSLVFPGIGPRFILPFFACGAVLLPFALRDERVLIALTVLLVLESFGRGGGRMISYQNLLAGSEPRALDSNWDWGQGLKELAEWRKQHPSGELALSLFGGAPPEIYGITKYRTLASFPEIALGGPEVTPLQSGKFSGYVAASANFLRGYAVDDPSLKLLATREPVICFQGALCLFDVRDAQ